MTEYLARINKKNTIMLMHGEKFSIIPITTHINLSDVNKYLTTNFLRKFLNKILKEIQIDKYYLNFKSIRFLCYNPHCGEEGTLGSEDKNILNRMYLFKINYYLYFANNIEHWITNEKNY